MRVRGPVNIRKTRRLSEAAVAALEKGNIDDLLRINRAEFGGATMMADADDDDDDADDDDDDSDSGTDDDDAGSKKKGSDKDDDSDDDDDLREENARLRKRMKAADKRSSDLEKRLEKIESGKGDDDKAEPDAIAQAKITELEKDNADLQSEVGTLRLEKAFLTSNKHKWHDPDVALSLANSQGFLDDVVDEDGEVSRKELRKALDRLAREHRYLVNTEGDKKKKKQDDKADDEPPAPSGQSSSRRSKNGDDAKARKQELRQRFPVLNNR